MKIFQIYSANTYPSVSYYHSSWYGGILSDLRQNSEDFKDNEDKKDEEEDNQKLISGDTSQRLVTGNKQYQLVIDQSINRFN